MEDQNLKAAEGFIDLVETTRLVVDPPASKSQQIEVVDIIERSIPAMVSKGIPPSIAAEAVRHLPEFCQHLSAYLAAQEGDLRENTRNYFREALNGPDFIQLAAKHFD